MLNISITINGQPSTLDNYDDVFTTLIKDHLQKKIEVAMTADEIAQMKFSYTGTNYDDLVLNIYGSESLKEKARIAITGK